MKRNRLYSVIRMAIAGSLLGTLTACGGGSDGSNEDTLSSGGSVGPVSGFGSVYVNGTHFNVNNATFTGNDGIERETQLEKGMILKVSGDWRANGEGVARFIHYDDTLRGPVQTMEWNAGTETGSLTIAGQTVALSGKTVFKGASPQELIDSVEGVSSDDYRVRISGWRLADGTFEARYVGAMKEGHGWIDEWSKTEVEGAVSSLDESASTFRINDLVVDYQMATFDDGHRTELHNGRIVEVEGELDGKGWLIAKEIEFEDDLFDNDDDVEISGAITAAYDSATGQFRLNGMPILINDDTDLDDDIALQHLVEGAEIKVEGEYRNGIIVAEELEQRDGNAELSGIIQSKEQGGEMLIVSGVRVMLTASTLIEDDRDEDAQDTLVMRTQDLEGLNPGDYLEIEGRETEENGGGLIAFHIERDDEGELELEGTVTGYTSNSLSVMGLELVASGYDLLGVEVGDKVSVEYFEQSGSFIIEEIEKED